MLILVLSKKLSHYAQFTVNKLYNHQWEHSINNGIPYLLYPVLLITYTTLCNLQVNSLSKKQCLLLFQRLNIRELMIKTSHLLDLMNTHLIKKKCLLDLEFMLRNHLNKKEIKVQMKRKVNQFYLQRLAKLLLINLIINKDPNLRWEVLKLLLSN